MVTDGFSRIGTSCAWFDYCKIHSELNKDPIGLTVSQLRTAIRILLSQIGGYANKILTAAVSGEDTILQHSSSLYRVGTFWRHVCRHSSPLTRNGYRPQANVQLELSQQLPQSLLLKIKRSVWIGDEKNKETVCIGAVRVAVQ